MLEAEAAAAAAAAAGVERVGQVAVSVSHYAISRRDIYPEFE